MSQRSIKQISMNALWYQNPSLVKFMGLCPLLAVSSTVVNAIGLGLSTLIVLILANTFSSLIRYQIDSNIRIPILIIIIAAIVTIFEMLMKSNFYELNKLLGIFVPLIAVNYIVFSRAESYGSKNALGNAFIDGLMVGLSFLIMLIIIGSIRELFGQGTLFVDMNLLFGANAKDWVIRPLGDDFRFRLLLIPPGALFVLGAIIALKNNISS